MDESSVILVPLENKHIQQVRKWRNDEEIRKSLFSWKPINDYQQQKWFESYCSRDDEVYFAVIAASKDEFIGTISLTRIDLFHMHAELGTLIGNKEYWGKGYASMALNKLLRFAFYELNLKRVYSFIFSDNVGSIKKNQRNGFKIEGTLRKHCFGNGELRDVVVMGILREDFERLGSE